MQESLLNLLRCPYSKKKLTLQVISKKYKQLGNNLVEVVDEAILFSPDGFLFPVIDGIPRMLLESIYDYGSFLQERLPDYRILKDELEKRHKSVLQFCQQKNKKTKDSFFLEWQFLKPQDNDKLWHDQLHELHNKFLQEADITEQWLRNKTVIDVGAGHGIMTGKIAEFADVVVGVELSRAVEDACKRNNRLNVHFVQGDLLFLPFENNSFDLLYSSGVLHHTSDTRHALSAVEQLVKSEGRICIWLYHPQQNKIHNMMLAVRKITSRLPLFISFPLLMIFLFPVSFLIKKIKGKRKLNYREEIIDILDMFTPEFRFEITHGEARKWLAELSYGDISITTIDQFGFSIVGIKKNQSLLNR